MTYVHVTIKLINMPFNKVHYTPLQSIEGAHLPLQGLGRVGGEPLMSVTRGQCDARPTVTSCEASLPIGWYHIILLGDRSTC